MVLSQPGKYAGTKKILIGETYTDNKSIAGLKGWQFREGTVITPLDDPEMMTVDVFQKGTTYVILFSVKEDTASKEFVIADILEIKNVVKGQEVKTGVCKEGETENVEIIGLIKPGNTEYSPVLKAWRFSRDKKRVEIKSIKNIKCLNEGFDQT